MSALRTRTMDFGEAMYNVFDGKPFRLKKVLGRSSSTVPIPEPSRISPLKRSVFKLPTLKNKMLRLVESRNWVTLPY
jgi:hypothetical protein